MLSTSSDAYFGLYYEVFVFRTDMSEGIWVSFFTLGQFWPDCKNENALKIPFFCRSGCMGHLVENARSSACSICSTCTNSVFLGKGWVHWHSDVACSIHGCMWTGFVRKHEALFPPLQSARRRGGHENHQLLCAEVLGKAQTRDGMLLPLLPHLSVSSCHPCTAWWPHSRAPRVCGGRVRGGGGHLLWGHRVQPLFNRTHLHCVTAVLYCQY